MVTSESPNKDILLIAQPKDYHTFIFRIPEYYEAFKHFTDSCWRLLLGIESVTHKESFKHTKSNTEAFNSALDIIERDFNDELQEYSIKFFMPTQYVRFLIARVRLGTLIRSTPVLQDGQIKFVINQDYVVKKHKAQEVYVNSLPVHTDKDNMKAVVDIQSSKNRKGYTEICEEYFKMHGEHIFLTQPVENLYYRFVDACLTNCRPVVPINTFVQYFTNNYFNISKEEVKEGIFINYFTKKEELLIADEMEQAITTNSSEEEMPHL